MTSLRASHLKQTSCKPTLSEVEPTVLEIGERLSLPVIKADALAASGLIEIVGTDDPRATAVAIEPLQRACAIYRDTRRRPRLVLALCDLVRATYYAGTQEEFDAAIQEMRGLAPLYPGLMPAALLRLLAVYGHEPRRAATRGMPAASPQSPARGHRAAGRQTRNHTRARASRHPAPSAHGHGSQTVTGRDERGMDSAQIAAAISAQIAALYTQSYEMPVKHATSYVLEDLVVALLDIELSLIERRMIEFGNGEQVHELHHAVEQAEAANFKAVVERATGRRVVAFASHIHLDPPFATELFRLGPSTAHPAEPR